MFAPPICRRSWRSNAFPFRRSDEDGGNSANIAASEASKIKQSASSLKARLRASGIARRRTEQERAEVFFPLRATTTAADPKRDARAASKKEARVTELVPEVVLRNGFVIRTLGQLGA